MGLLFINIKRRKSLHNIAEIFCLKKIKPSFIPAILWVIISTVLLTIPGSAFPKQNWLNKIWFDKWVHIGMFILMVVLWCWAIHKKNISNTKLKNRFLLIGLSSLLYGIVMELVQHYFIVNRSFEIGDIIADATGCSIGIGYSRWRLIKKIDPCGNRGRNQN